MSFYPNSSQNRTGLGYVPPTSVDKMSNVTVTVTEREGAPAETFTLTQAQEDFAQKVASTGKWEEMPHASGRRQIRQRVLDIMQEKLAAAGGAMTGVVAPKASTSGGTKAKSKSEYVWVVSGSTGVVGIRRLKSEAKALAEDIAGVTLDWDNVDKKRSVATVNDNEVYAVQETLVPKSKN